MTHIRSLLALMAAAIALHSGAVAAQSITLASTTSVEASGLLTNILPRFTAKTGITVHVVAQGTGKALDTARRGDADLLLVHDPEAEQQFIDEGHGVARRRSPGTILSLSVRPPIRRMCAAKATASRPSKPLPPRGRPSCRAATTAAPMQPNCGSGNSPDKPRRSGKHGTATLAAAWARR